MLFFCCSLDKEQSQTDLTRASIEATQKLTELNNKISQAREQVSGT